MKDYKWLVLENIVIILAVTSIIVYGHTLHGLWLLIFMNTFKSSK